MHLEERATELGVGVCVVALWHSDAVAFRHQLERLKETDALDFHDEFEQIASGAAAEAPVKLMGGMDRERRRLFGVERAEAGVAGGAAGFLQAHVLFDGFDDVDGDLNLLGEIHVRCERPLLGNCCSYR